MRELPYIVCMVLAIASPTIAWAGPPILAKSVAADCFGPTDRNPTKNVVVTLDPLTFNFYMVAAQGGGLRYNFMGSQTTSFAMPNGANSQPNPAFALKPGSYKLQIVDLTTGASKSPMYPVSVKACEYGPAPRTQIDKSLK